MYIIIVVKTIQHYSNYRQYYNRYDYNEHISQVTVDDKSMIRRIEHTITAITISSSLVVVVVFGGGDSTFSNVLSDTVVLEFGE